MAETPFEQHVSAVGPLEGDRLRARRAAAQPRQPRAGAQRAQRRQPDRRCWTLARQLVGPAGVGRLRSLPDGSVYILNTAGTVPPWAQ